MTYNTSLPLSSDPIRKFPGDVTTNNWPRLSTQIGIDHQFNNTAASNDGWHKVIHHIQQGADPAASTVGQTYTKEVVVTTPADTDDQLFFMTKNGVVKQLTGISSAATNGYTTLPNGLLMQWGRASVALGDNNVLFPAPFTSAVYSVVITPRRTTTTNVDIVYVKTGGASLTTTKFIAVNTSSSGITEICWMAIGV